MQNLRAPGLPFNIKGVNGVIPISLVFNWPVFRGEFRSVMRSDLLMTLAEYRSRERGPRGDPRGTQGELAFSPRTMRHREFDAYAGVQKWDRLNGAVLVFENPKATSWGKNRSREGFQQHQANNFTMSLDEKLRIKLIYTIRKTGPTSITKGKE